MKKKFILSGIIGFLLTAVVSTSFAAFVVGGGDLDQTATGPTISTGEVDSNIVNLVNNSQFLPLYTKYLSYLFNIFNSLTSNPFITIINLNFFNFTNISY